jgi:hypothetical protein
VLLVCAVTRGFAPPPLALRRSLLGVLARFFPYNFNASLAAVGFFAVSAPVLILFIFFNFENTKSQECVYCITFFLACLAESMRLLIPLFNLWTANPAFLNVVARIVFFGRLVAALSFFTCAATLVNTQYQESGKFLIILTVASGFFSVMIPVNTLHLRANCGVEAGFTRLVATFQIILCLITVFVFLFVTDSYDKKDSRILTLGYALFFSGYGLLTAADSVFFACLGAACFILGMRIYMGTVHKIYMWK